MSIILGKFSEDDWNSIIRESYLIIDTGSRIDFLSSKFLGIAYAESTLTGGRETPEIFVINLAAVDCFTFLEYVESMRLSKSFAGFRKNLRQIRYRSGIVSFETRNHFFTDWRIFNKTFVEDVTQIMGNDSATRVQKRLNAIEDNASMLPGIPSVERNIDFIPADEIGDMILNSLKTGDYIGIYSDKTGLDVSHVGILIKEGHDIFLRHASSKKEYREVIDQDFKEYVAHKPGIVVLRPRGYYSIN